MTSMSNHTGVSLQAHIGDGLAPDSFAVFFQTKVRSISQRAKVSPNVYNGKRKVDCHDKMFMSKVDITECVRSIKINMPLSYINFITSNSPP